MEYIVLNNTEDALKIARAAIGSKCNFPCDCEPDRIHYGTLLGIIEESDEPWFVCEASGTVECSDYIEVESEELFLDAHIVIREQLKVVVNFVDVDGAHYELKMDCWFQQDREELFRIMEDNDPIFTTIKLDIDYYKNNEVDGIEFLHE